MWSAGDGDSERVKIVTGIDASACDGFQVTEFEAIDDVNSSGAVSPATRATPSIAPVISPPAADGSTIRRTIRQRAIPSATAASRSALGTSRSTS